ncbi:MAG: tetratricopeptide repeat protein [bacterium]|nr:tetratricopeptide repeat protein [bacterium]
MKRIIFILIIILIASSIAYADESAEYIYKKAMKFYMIKKFEYALIEFDKMIQVYPENELTHKAVFFKGVSLFYLCKNNNDSALSEVEEIFKDYIRKYPDKEYFPSSVKWVGDIYYLTGDYETAVEKYLDSLEKYPLLEVNDMIMYNLAKCREKQEKYVLAKTILERILEKYPETDLKKQIEFDLNRLNTILDK